MSGVDSVFTISSGGHRTRPAAYLVFMNTETREQSLQPVLPREYFYVGRREVEKFLGVTDPTISARQLYFHCLVYEDDESHGIPPMVYVQDLSRNGTVFKRATNGMPLPDAISSCVLDREVGAVLLNHGDELCLTETIVIKFESFSFHQILPDPFAFVQKQEMKPNIITVEQVFFTTHNIYIMQELITGGDLFSFLNYKRGRLEDVEAAVVVRQLLKAVEYLHDMGVVHRDIKPDNVLMTSWRDGARIVLTDFGHATRIELDGGSKHADYSKHRMHSTVGTYEFTAPEVHGRNRTIPKDRGYSNAIDMWSVGAIAATLLSGDVIFVDRKDEAFENDPLNAIMTLAERCDLSIVDCGSVWKSVGHRPKAFVKSLLVLEEDRRLTAKQALQHPWFTNHRHAAEFEGVYQRAISDWKPRTPNKILVESVDTSRLGPVSFPTNHRQVPQTSEISHYFNTPFKPPVPRSQDVSPLSKKTNHTSLPPFHEGVCSPDR